MFLAQCFTFFDFFYYRIPQVGLVCDILFHEIRPRTISGRHYKGIPKELSKVVSCIMILKPEKLLCREWRQKSEYIEIR